MPKKDKYTDWINECMEIVSNEHKFNNFKNNPIINNMLEHTPENLGKNYILLIIEEFSEIINKINWKKCQENDKIGNTKTYEFLELSSFVSIDNYFFSPSTLQYIYVSLKMLKLIQNLNKNDNEYDIIEIGGGYGGQCLVFHYIAESFNIKIKSYTLIDLSSVSLLQEKYLKLFNLENIHCYKAEEYDNFKNIFSNINYDLFICSWALSEMPIHYSQKYYDDIVTKSHSGFIAWNGEDPNDKKILSINDFNKNKFNNLKIIPSPLYTINKKNIIYPWEKEHAKFVKYIMYHN